MWFHSDADTYEHSNANPDADPNSDFKPNPNSDAHADADSNTDSNAYSVWTGLRAKRHLERQPVR